jgi:hypothetical protein
MKEMLADIELRMPGRKDTMIRALANVRASHLLDPKAFDFTALLRSGADLAVEPQQVVPGQSESTDRCSGF